MNVDASGQHGAHDRRGGRRGAGGAKGGRGGSGPSSGRDGGSRIEGPGGAREPIGRERAVQRGDAPPRRSRQASTAPPKPALPSDEQPVLPRGVRKEIDRTLGPGPKANDVALALSIGSAAIEDDRPDVALEVLAWAKHEAPRLAPVREAYGVALYLAERFSAALTELQAYRRLTGRLDQNHLVADCLRAVGRDLDQVAQAAEPLLADDEAPEDRRAEAAIVWAAALADGGDIGAGRAVLRRFLERRRPQDAEHDLRVRWLMADLAERDGDRTEAARQLASIVAADPGFLDAAERLDALRDAGA